MRQLVAVASVLWLAGCAGSPSARRPAPTPTPAPAAPVVAELIQRRPGALIDKITVRTDGSGVFDRPSGGVGRVQRDVLVDGRALRALRRGLAEVPAHLRPATGAPSPNGATYILRFGGRTVVAREGAEPKPLRESIHLLAGLLVGDHVSRIVDERLGGLAGSTHSPKPRTVVFFQRQGAGGATLDTITVRDDGSVELQKRYGGAGGRFTALQLHDGQLARLRRELARLPGAGTLTRGSPPPGGAQYLLRYRGRTMTGREGGIVPAARPALRRLDGYIDGIGVRRVRTESRTHRP